MDNLGDNMDSREQRRARRDIVRDQEETERLREEERRFVEEQRRRINCQREQYIQEQKLQRDERIRRQELLYNRSFSDVDTRRAFEQEQENTGVYLTEVAFDNTKRKVDATRSEGYLSDMKRKSEDEALKEQYETDKRRQGEIMRQQEHLRKQERKQMEEIRREAQTRSLGDDFRTEGYLLDVKRQKEEEALKEQYVIDKRRQGEIMRQEHLREQERKQMEEIRREAKTRSQGDDFRTEGYLSNMKRQKEEEALKEQYLMNKRIQEDIHRQEHLRQQERKRMEERMRDDTERQRKREIEEERQRLEYLRAINKHKEDESVTATKEQSDIFDETKRRLSLDVMGHQQGLIESDFNIIDELEEHSSGSDTEGARQIIIEKNNSKEDKKHRENEARLNLEDALLFSKKPGEESNNITPVHTGRLKKPEPLDDIEKEIAALDRRLTILSREGYLQDTSNKKASATAYSSKVDKACSLNKPKKITDINVEKREMHNTTADSAMGQTPYIPYRHLVSGPGSDAAKVSLYDETNERLLPSRTNVRRQLDFETLGQHQGIYTQDYLSYQGYRQPIEMDYLSYSPMPLHPYYDDLRNRVHWPDTETMYTSNRGIYPPTMTKYETDSTDHLRQWRKGHEDTMKRETDISYQAALLTERRKMAESIKAQEEEMKKKELELNTREIWIKEQEELRKMKEIQDPFDQVLTQRVKELKQKMERLKERDSDLSIREKALRTEKKVEEKQQPEVQSRSKSQSTMTEDATQSVAAKDTKITCENPFLFPKISQFSGEDPKPKNEASYEEWKYEVNCLRKEHNENNIAQAIRKSLRGQAKKVLLPLGTSASITDVMAKIEGVFGNVATGESVLREFYTASQTQDETVASWGLRLEEMLQKAMDKGHLKPDQKNDMLREKFWRALRSDRLKNATRVHYESISNFELLRRAVRAEEHEMKVSTGIKQQQMKVECKKDEAKVESTSTEQILDRLTYLEKQLKYRNNRRKSWNQNRPRENDPKAEEKKKDDEKTMTEKSGQNF